jgi:hypothetical protein
MAREAEDKEIVSAQISPGSFAYVMFVTVDGRTYEKDEVPAAQTELLMHLIRRVKHLEAQIDSFAVELAKRIDTLGAQIEVLDDTVALRAQSDPPKT